MNIKHIPIFDRAFYDRSPEKVARDLLGNYFVRKIGSETLVGKIVETEAYLSGSDEASHGFKGLVNRNKSLYKDAGHAYVHSMRQWFLIDVVTEGVDIPSSVLIRAVEPTEGIEVMKRFRKDAAIKNIANGPGKFCQAFHIQSDLDGVDMTSEKSPLYICKSEQQISRSSVGVSSRIGISKAVDMPLRFWIKNNTYTSR